MEICTMMEDILLWVNQKSLCDLSLKRGENLRWFMSDSKWKQKKVVCAQSNASVWRNRRPEELSLKILRVRYRLPKWVQLETGSFIPGVSSFDMKKETLFRLQRLQNFLSAEETEEKEEKSTCSSLFKSHTLTSKALFSCRLVFCVVWSSLFPCRSIVRRI